MNKLLLFSVFVASFTSLVYSIGTDVFVYIKRKKESKTISNFIKTVAQSFFINKDINTNNAIECQKYICENLEEYNLFFKIKKLSVETSNSSQIEIQFILKDNSKELLLHKLLITKKSNCKEVGLM